MRQLTASPATRVPASPERDHGNGTDLEPSRGLALLEALAYAGAFIDPTGVLAIQRLRRSRDDQDDR